jgi:glycosyltransferase involved in cell wall biosynthesis
MPRTHPRESSAPGVSVIVPIYNRAATVRRAIESALSQNVETDIIIVDDGSTDDSPSVVRSFGDRVRYFRQENRGPSSARNLGARLGRFPILAFLDSDDEFLPGCLAAHVACRKANPGLRLSIGLKNKTAQAPELFYRRGGFYYLDGFHHYVVSGIHISSVCVNRDVFESAGGFDPLLRCWEVTEFMYRALLAGQRIGFLDRNYVVIHKDPTDSQFQRLRTELRFHVRYAHRIIDLLDKLPTDQREVALRATRSRVKGLLKTGARAEARAILRRLTSSGKTDRETTALYAFSFLPSVLLQPLVAARKLVRHG